MSHEAMNPNRLSGAYYGSGRPFTGTPDARSRAMRKAASLAHQADIAEGAGKRKAAKALGLRAEKLRDAVYREEHTLGPVGKLPNSTPNEYDDLDDEEQYYRMGTQQARALGRSQKGAVHGYEVSWYSPRRSRRVKMPRLIEAHTKAQAIAEVKALATEGLKKGDRVGRPVNFVAREKNPKAGNPLEPLTSADAASIAEFLGARVPLAKASLSELGGSGRASILIVFSMEPREAWGNGILENSNYARFHLGQGGKLELFSGSLYRIVPFRKATVKSLADAKRKLGDYVDKVKARLPNPGLMELAGGLQAYDYLKKRRIGNPWACLECGRTFKSAAAAERAAFGDNGCPGCGGSDIDYVDAAEVKAIKAEKGGGPARRPNAGGARVVHNRLLGGWYVVRGSHQTPLSGRFDSKAEAQAWLRGDYNPRGPARRNPSIQAIGKSFQGRTSKAKVTMKAAAGAPADLARLGKLVFLKLGNREIRVPGAMLAADTKGKLWIAGSRAPLFRVKAKRGEGLDYGEISGICYQTAKAHIGQGKTFEYVHKFGEEGGKRPHLVIDSEGMPLIRGGAYRIESQGITD